MGLISPLGNDADQLWEAVSTGRSGVRALSSLPSDHLSVACAGEAWDFGGKIDDFGPLDKLAKRNIRKGMKLMCREIQMGVAAAQHALNDAHLGVDVRDSDRTGIVYGSDYIMTLPDDFIDGVKSCQDSAGEFQVSKWAECGIDRVDPLWLLKYLPNMPASHIAIYNDLRGPNNSITVREASANLAIGEAFSTIKRGAADAIIAGATGTRVHPLRTLHICIQEQLANGDEPARQSRPFDKSRTGMVIAEGAGALILEELAIAKQRGAEIYAEVIGYGSSTVMSRDGEADVQRAIGNVLRQSLGNTGLRPDEVGHIHAHGLSTRHCDREEARAIQSVFSNESTPVTALKSFTGNVGAASGMLETIASILCLRHNKLAPILNLDELDPECPISPNRSLDASPGSTFINVNTSPQGQASAIAMRRFDG